MLLRRQRQLDPIVVEAASEVSIVNSIVPFTPESVGLKLGQTAIRLSLADDVDSTSSIVLRHNTFFATGPGENNSVVSNELATDLSSGEIAIANNILVITGSDVGAIHDNRPIGSEGELNVFSGTNLVDVGRGTNAAGMLRGRIIEADPLLDDALCIPGNSPAVNTGDDLGEGAVTVDIRGLPRPGVTNPASSEVDLGACEFQGDLFVGPFLRGDCNGDGDISSGGVLTDVIFLLEFDILGNGEVRCRASCDYNGDGAVGSADTITDVIYFLTFSILGGPPPPAPFPTPGASTSPEDLRLGCLEPSP